MLIASRVYEKDVFMSVNHCMDLKQRLGSAEINLPQVFVHGHLLGVRLTRMLMLYSETKFFPAKDADTVEKLNESGELRQLLRPFQVRFGES